MFYLILFAVMFVVLILVARSDRKFPVIENRRLASLQRARDAEFFDRMIGSR